MLFACLLDKSAYGLLYRHWATAADTDYDATMRYPDHHLAGQCLAQANFTGLMPLRMFMLLKHCCVVMNISIQNDAMTSSNKSQGLRLVRSLLGDDER